MKKLNLNALDTMRHVVEMDGVAYRVKPLTARIAGLVSVANDTTGLAQVGSTADVVAALVPDMPRHLVDDLTLVQLASIIELAGTEVRAVEDAVADPNGASPPGKAPRRATRSAASS